MLRSSDDGGASWDAPRVLIAAHDGWGFGDPSLVALPNGDVLCLYVASRGLSFWDDERPDGAWQMRLAVSHNDGVTWHHRDITADLLAGHASLPSGELAVAWEHGNYADIRFATIAPSGRNY